MKLCRVVPFLLIFAAQCRASPLPAPASVQVNLAWQAPTVSIDPVVGYNAFRVLGGGAGYQQLNATPLPLTATGCADLTVQPGQTYNYVVESVDAEGVASTASNMASATLPSITILAAGTLTGNTN